MEREILFRGKRNDGSGWMFGFYFKSGNDGFIMTGKMQACAIIPETRGEFTGLTDKNGTRIFEGDIVKVKLPGIDKTNIGVITYGKYNGYVPKEHIGFHLEGLKHTGIQGIGFYRDIEVIGNIHDNPELVGG